MALDLLAAAAAAPAAALAPAPRGQGRLSELQRWSIVALHNDGRTGEYIAHKLQCSERAVYRVLKRFRQYNTPVSGSRSGRPRSTSEADDISIAVTARVEPFTPPRGIRRKLDLDVSPRTIDRRLREAGLFGRVARHKRVYAAAEIRSRLAFAEGYKHWTADQWSKVLFSDEKTFFGKGFCGRTWVRREVGTAFSPELCVNKTAHPVKVNVWGCFSAAGPGYLHVFYENMDSALYLSILKDNLIDVARRDFALAPPAIAPWHFLQDNAPMHKANIVRDWLHTAGVSVLDFPPYSPDLNPIENLWATLARAVENHSCDDDDALGDAVITEWNKLPADIFSNLARSMPERCQEVVKAKGHHTEY